MHAFSQHRFLTAHLGELVCCAAVCLVIVYSLSFVIQTVWQNCHKFLLLHTRYQISPILLR